MTIAQREAILSRDNHECVYCGYEAVEVDHIIPWSFGGTDDPDNLAASCRICNAIASSKIFDTFDAKREYIRAQYGPFLKERIRRVMRTLSICGDCRSIFVPNVDGASAVLCADCYDKDDQSCPPPVMSRFNPDWTPITVKKKRTAITESDVVEMKCLHSAGMSQAQIGLRFGIAQPAVSEWLRGKRVPSKKRGQP